MNSQAAAVARCLSIPSYAPFYLVYW